MDEDIDLLPDAGGASFSLFDMLFYGTSYFIIDDTVTGPSTTTFVNGKTKHFYSLNSV